MASAPARTRTGLALAGLLLACPAEDAARPDAAPSRGPPAARPTARAEPSTLVLGTTQEPATLDPAFAVRSGAQAIVRLLYPDLTVFDDRGRVVPRLAATLPEVRSSSTGLEVSWTLRRGLRWSDGRPLTSEDVVFGHRIETRPDLEAVNFDLARRVRRIEPLGPRRFRVDWQGNLRGVSDPRVHAVLPRHAYPDEGAVGAGGLGRGPAPSSGPYRVTAWRPGDRMVLEPNPHWPGPAPRIARLVWRFLPSADAFETELSAGSIDALGPASGLGHEAAWRLGRRLEPSHVVEATPGGLLLQLTPRLDDPVVGRRAVRAAIDAALDRGRLVELVYRGYARPARGLFGPVHPARPAPDPAASRARPEAARALLEGLDRPVLTLGFASESAASGRAATVVQAQLEAVGFEVRMRALPLRTLYARLSAGQGTALTLFAWRTRPDWSGRALLRSDGRLNHAGYSRPEVDALLDRAAGTLDREAWVGLLRALDGWVRRDWPLIPLVFRDDVSIRPRDLEGWRPTGTTTPVTWNAERWRWREAGRR